MKFATLSISFIGLWILTCFGFTFQAVAAGCDLCGVGYEIVNLDAQVALPGKPTRTCKELITENDAGNIDADSCDLLTMFTPELCCGPTRESFTVAGANPVIETDPPTIAPTVAALPDLVGTAVGAGSFTILVAALEAANLVEALSGPSGPFTVFAPSDAAFEGLPEGLLDALLVPGNIEFLSVVLLYHVIPGRLLSADLSDGMVVETLGSDAVTLSVSDTGIMVNQAKVVTSDILASNGVIHVIDSVLVPPSLVPIIPDIIGGGTSESSAPEETDPPSSDLVGTVVGAEGFTTLVTALEAANLVEALSEPSGPFTVFAPSNTAFGSLPEGLVDGLLIPDNAQFLTDVLLYHVIPGSVMTADLFNGMVLETLGSDTVEIAVSNETGIITINQAGIVNPDVTASNGVIHVIDDVLVPPRVLSIVPEIIASVTAESSAPEETDPPLPDLVGTAVGAGEFTTLVTALQAANLVEALSEPMGPYTVFAPSDAAFATLPEGLVAALLVPENANLLTEILLYHVVAGTLLSTDFTDSLMVETLGTSTVEITISDTGIRVNQANVVTPDITASNGVIHVIDNVLVPPDVLPILPEVIANFTAGTDAPVRTQSPEPEPLPDIVTIAARAGNFDTLVEALAAADLVGELAFPAGPFTVFAPVDAAFEELPPGLLETLLDLASSSILTDILLYHVVPETLLAEDIVDGMNVTTVLGETLTLTLFNDTSVSVDDVPVVEPNMLASNGVIHAIAGVLLPPGLDIDLLF